MLGRFLSDVLAWIRTTPISTALQKLITIKNKKRQKCRSSNRKVSVFLFVSRLGELGVSFSISAFWRPVALGESQQLEHVESIPSAFDILQYVLYAASFSGERAESTTS